MRSVHWDRRGRGQTSEVARTGTFMEVIGAEGVVWPRVAEGFVTALISESCVSSYISIYRVYVLFEICLWP